jgi:hypothetical protein
LEESGLSRNDQYVIVAAVVVDADKQYKLVEGALRELSGLWPDKSAGKPFVFHAAHLYHGSGIFDRRKYPDEGLRMHCLNMLCTIPQFFDLTVIFAIADRQKAPALAGKRPKQVLAVTHGVASYFCALGVEMFMRKHAESSEVAMLVYENNNDSKSTIRSWHNVMRSHQLPDPIAAGLVPFQRIVEAPLFAEKSESSLLQIADACAFAALRKMKGDEKGVRLYERFAKRIFMSPEIFGPPYEGAVGTLIRRDVQ